MKTLKIKGKSKTHKVQVTVYKREKCTNRLCAAVGYHSWGFHPIILSDELGDK